MRRGCDVWHVRISQRGSFAIFPPGTLATPFSPSVIVDHSVLVSRSSAPAEQVPSGAVLRGDSADA